MEFKENAVKLVLEQDMSIGMAANRLSIPNQTLDNWVRKAKAGKSFKSGSKTVTDVEAEISLLRRELAEVKMERDILKKATGDPSFHSGQALQRGRCPVSDNKEGATHVSIKDFMPGLEGIDKRLL